MTPHTFSIVSYFEYLGMFGVFPWEFDSSLHLVISKRFGALYGLIVVLSSFGFCFQIYETFSFFGCQLILYLLIPFFMFMIIPFITSSGIYKLAFAREEFQDCFKKLLSVSANIELAPIKFLTRVKLMICAFVVHAILDIIHLYNSNISIIICGLAWQISHLVILQVVVPFSSVVDLVDRYFEQLHQLLLTNDRRSNLKTLDLLRIYDELIFVIDRLCDAYGFQVLSVVLFAFMCAPGLGFFFIDELSRGQMFTYAVFDYAATTSHQILLVTSTMALCSSTIKKAEQFSKLLATRALNDKTGQFLANPHVAMHFASRKKVEFNVCGCFNLDLRLGCSMLAACVTYLVILVQINDQKK